MTEQVDLLTFKSSNVLTSNKISELVSEKLSFCIEGVKDVPFTVNRIEKEIEKQGFRCRVYTEYRSAAIAGTLIPSGITQVVGLATAVGIGAHNLATINPDFEIIKNRVTDKVTVVYKK